MMPLPSPPALTASQSGEPGYLVDATSGLVVAVVGGFRGTPPAGMKFIAASDLSVIVIGKPPPS